jgi:hypothetical protein
MALEPAQEGQPRGEDQGNDFVAKIVIDPNSPPQTLLLSGYIGNASVENHTRLYLDAELSDYVDIPNDAILHTAHMPADQGPLRGSYIWIKRDAPVLHAPATTARRQASFLEGRMQRAFDAAAAAPPAPAPATIPLFACPATQPQICTIQTQPFLICHKTIFVQVCNPTHVLQNCLSHVPAFCLTHTPALCTQSGPACGHSGIVPCLPTTPAGGCFETQPPCVVPSLPGCPSFGGCPSVACGGLGGGDPVEFAARAAALPDSRIPVQCPPATTIPIQCPTQFPRLCPTTPSARCPVPSTPAAGCPTPTTPAAGCPLPTTPAAGCPLPTTPAAGCHVASTPAAGCPGVTEFGPRCDPTVFFPCTFHAACVTISPNLCF